MWGNATNNTGIIIDKAVLKGVNGDVTITNTTTVTTTTTLNGAVTVVTINNTFTSDRTENGNTTRQVVRVTVNTNITSDATANAIAWGTCNPPIPEITGLHCYNCIFIPSMANFNVCIDDNEVRILCYYKINMNFKI